MLEWALKYIRLAWPVIPLRGKLPLTENGSKDASLNETQVRAWWAKWPDANIGLATGGEHFAIDIDIKGGGDETWDMLRAQHGSYPDTAEQVTGTGGRHILFAMPDFPVHNSQGKLGPGIDVRGAGGYIVAAPSIHPETKRRYSWDGDVAGVEGLTVAPAPAWLLRLLRMEIERPRQTTNVPEKIAEGRRNDTLFRAGAGLRRRGWTADEIFASLLVINRNRCHPPLPEAELRTIADSAAKYAPDPHANVFRGAAAPAMEPEELPLAQSDIEAAVDDAIARNDLAAAVALVENIAKLRPAAQLLIETKLRLRFKKEFPASAFRKVLTGDAKVVVMPPPGGDDSTPAGPDLLAYPYTDSGNGERIVTLYGKELRYCIEMQKWLVWDGRRWAVDERNLATQRAKEMARLLYAQAVRAPNSSVTEKWARTSESAAGIAAALKRASTERGIPVSAAELDSHSYLLNCANGVLDLRTGDLLPHDRGYLITKLCHIEYHPEAKCPRFLKFLHWAMGDNPDADMSPQTVRLISFLQRAFGYSLTADVSEKAAFVFWGPKGNNGKTTLLTTWRTLLSEYSAQISIDVLMTSRGQDAAVRADLADLRGARLVTTSEVEKEHKLSEGKLKYITAGMGKIKSCRKYENPIEFEATHKLFMDCNHRPRVTGTDDAIWTRLKAIPFEVSITRDDPEFDKKLLEKLVAEGPGILAWGARGCKAWMEEGLGDTPEIDQANQEWREHDDPLKEFLEDCCEVGDGRWVQGSELSAAYVWWCKKNHERFSLGKEAFGDRLKSKGFEQSRSRRDKESAKQLRTWEGLGMREGIAVEMKSDSKWQKSLVED